MRLKSIAWLSVVLMTFSGFSAHNQKFVQPTKDDVGVYKNDVREV